MMAAMARMLLWVAVRRRAFGWRGHAGTATVGLPPGPPPIPAALDGATDAASAVWVPIMDATVERGDAAAAAAVAARLGFPAFLTRRPLFSARVAPAFADAYVRALLKAAGAAGVPLPPKLVADAFRVLRRAPDADAAWSLFTAVRAHGGSYPLDIVDVNALLACAPRHLAHAPPCL
jgi:hypothetical protein